VFQNLVPPAPGSLSRLTDRQPVRRDLCELSPFVWQGRLCAMECVRPATGGAASDYYLLLKDAETGEELARCAEGHGLASLLVHNDTFYIFASRWGHGNWQDVTLFKSSNLKDWESKVVIEGENEGIFNTSVCPGPDGFVMAYESNDPAYPPFTVKFARSSDLEQWTKIPEATFGTNRYTACPCIRYANGWYYVLYLEQRTPRWFFETYLTRSQDLRHWELSAANPVLRAEGLDEGINASDPELVEFQGKTYVYYAVGDQRTWMNIKRAAYPGPMAEFLESWYASPGIPDWGTAAGAAQAN
jgi:alpha-L-fucosidase